MKNITSLIKSGMDWDTYEKYRQRTRLPKDRSFIVECLSKEAQKFLLGDQSVISLEVGYAHKRRAYVIGNIKAGDLSQRVEGNVTWDGKKFHGRLKLKPPIDRESLWKESDVWTHL